MDTSKSSLVIYRAIETNKKGQSFGESKACTQTHPNGTAIRPFRVIAKKGFTCPVGYTSFYEAIGLKGHNGEDWSAKHAEPLHFPAMAPTTWYSKDASDMDGGLGVDVYSKDPIYLEKLPKETGPQAREYWEQHGKMIRVKFRFWHLLEGKTDSDVQFGELIGYCDNTGSSSGTHLHKCMKFVDEFDQTFDTDNGYHGAVDESLFYQNKYVLEVLGIYKKELTSIIQKLQQLVYSLQKYLDERAKKRLQALI